MSWVVLKTLLLAFTALALSSCSFFSEKCDSMTTDNLAAQGPEAFRVFKNSDGRELDPLKESTNGNEVASLLQIIDNADGKWRIESAGVPVGSFRVVFYKSDERIGSFSFGETFIVAQGCGYFASASIPNSDRKTLLQATGLTVEDLQ